jgi:hypothetical protein
VMRAPRLALLANVADVLGHVAFLVGLLDGHQRMLRCSPRVSGAKSEQRRRCATSCGLERAECVGKQASHSCCAAVDEPDHAARAGAPAYIAALGAHVRTASCGHRSSAITEARRR